MSYWVKEGEENKALTQAELLSLDDLEQYALKYHKENPPAPKENANGSFERLMLGFGNGMQKG